MAVLNQGNKRSWVNGGSVGIGADTIENIRNGTLSFTEGLREKMMQRDKNKISGAPIPGQERPCTVKVELDIERTGGLLEILNAMLGSPDGDGRHSGVDSATGLTKVFSLTIKIPDHETATVGDQYVWDKAYLNAPPDVTMGTGEGDNFDRVTLDIETVDASPKKTRYGA